VDISVGIDGHADGSGRVLVSATLDKDAAAQAGPLALDDLRRAGWAVDGPRTESEGRSVVRASKPFRTPAEASAAVADVAGGNGPFRDFRLTHRRSLLTTRSSFTGTVDLGPGLSAFADDGLRKSLGGPGLGLDPAAVKQATGVDLDKIFRFTVTARLPGSVTSSNAPSHAGNGAVWHPVLGERVELTAASRRYNTGPLLALGALALAVLAGVGVGARRLLDRR
jgi:hypothetical protein